MKNKTKITNALKAALKHKIGKGVIEGSSLSQKQREALVEAGWLTEILRGWYILSQPAGKDAVTVVWYESFWDFLKTYLHKRYGLKYCLSPVESLLYHSKSNTIPSKINVYISKKSTAIVDLRFIDTQIIIFNSPLVNSAIDLDGLKILPAHIALASLPPVAYKEHHIAIKALLSNAAIHASTEEYIDLNDKHMAKERLSGFFNYTIPIKFTERSPAAGRVEGLWNAYAPIINNFFEKSEFKYFDSFASVDKHIEEQFKQDSYNSLTIEGYEVTLDTIEKIHAGEIEFSKNDDDNKRAVVGYSLAYKQVKADILASLDNDLDMPDVNAWRMLLFSSMAEEESAMRQYRREAVFIRGSMHVPVNFSCIIDCMDTLRECIEGSQNDLPITRAALSHILLVYIHPWSDGNGRTSRFLMNYFLCKEKLPWLIIKHEERQKYFNALEEAQVSNNIVPFMNYIQSILDRNAVVASS